MKCLYHKWKIFLAIITILIMTFIVLNYSIGILKPSSTLQRSNPMEIKLPSPAYKSTISIEAAIYQRRSVRAYKNEHLTLQQISQLLWAAQGLTSKRGFRTTPSAGALYPLEIYLVTGNIKNLSSGIYHYLPNTHSLKKISNEDSRIALSDAALQQNAIKEAACNIIISADFSRTIRKYGARGKRFVYMEAGHAAQNIYLQSVSLHIGTVSIGAFNDALVKKTAELPSEVEPLYILPIGNI